MVTMTGLLRLILLFWACYYLIRIVTRWFAAGGGADGPPPPKNRPGGGEGGRGAGGRPDDAPNWEGGPAVSWPGRPSSAGMPDQMARTSSTSGTKCRSRFWMPCFSVAVEDGQPEQAPRIDR